MLYREKERAIHADLDNRRRIRRDGGGGRYHNGRGRRSLVPFSSRAMYVWWNTSEM